MSPDPGTAIPDGLAQNKLTSDPRGTPPSLFVRMVVKPMTRLLNPGIRRLAGRKHPAMVAQIHHRGRQSGRSYVTPASARLIGDTFLIPLTFGDQSDWCHNVQSAGGCVIRWKATEYTAMDPEVIDISVALAEGRSAFNPVERVFLRVMGIKKFLRLKVSPPTGRQHH